MTTLVIEIPDNETADISDIVKAKGGSAVSVNADDEDLTPAELDMIKRGLKEALLIKEGKIKTISIDDLWND